MKWTIKKAEACVMKVEMMKLPKDLTYWAAVDYLRKMRRERWLQIYRNEEAAP